MNLMPPNIMITGEDYAEILNTLQALTAQIPNGIAASVADQISQVLAQCEPVVASVRQDSVLDEAAKIIHGVRQQEYGGPAQSFGRIAALWNAYLKRLDGWHELNEHDVAMLMILLKVSRSKNGIDANGKPQRDSLVDIIGYAGCSDLVTGSEEL